MGHVDATLRLLDPSVEIDAIPNKRLTKRIKLFRQGELGRLILGVLRNADTPQSTAAIVSAVLATGGHSNAARPTMAPRVRGNRAYQERRGLVRRPAPAKTYVGRWHKKGPRAGRAPLSRRSARMYPAQALWWTVTE